MVDTSSRTPRITSESEPNLLNYICGRPPLFSPEQQLLNWLVVILVVMLFLYAFENAIISVPLVWQNVVGGFFFSGIYWLGRFKRAPIGIVANITFGSNLLFITLAWLSNDGIHGSTLFLYIATLVSIMSVFRGKSWIIWTLAMFTHLVVMIMLQFSHPDWITPYASLSAQRFDIAFTFFTVAIFMMGYVGVNMYNLDARRKVADALLLNILPEEIADRLKYLPTEVIAENCPEASILFADIVGFTPLSVGLMPAEVVELLNAVFSYFDSLVGKYSVEKIKTVGDCFMIAAGVPKEQSDHAQRLARLALEMRDYVITHDFLGRRLHLRIGINSGPVVAGVIGQKKFSYDLWGDAVNTASRMESHGRANTIQITRATYDLIKDDFTCNSQGSIDIKGKGSMEVWYVMTAKRECCDDHHIT